MAYIPIAPNLPNGAVFTADHIAHIEDGILNADVDSRDYIDGIAQQIQAGQVTDPAFDAAVDRAAAEGRLVVEGGGSAQIDITEVQQGVYDITSGDNGGTIYGLTSAQTLPAAALGDLNTRYTLKDEASDTAVAALLNNPASSTGSGVRAQFVPWGSTTANVKNPAFAGGAKGDGTTDDSAAVAAAMATGKHVYFPPGVYVGTWNFDVSAPRVFGAGEGTTIIKVNAGEHFIDANRIWHGSLFEGIRFEGGAGAIRNRFTSTNTTTKHVVRDCYFLNYTGAAISHNSQDMPLWSIEDNVFRGANDETTIGIALSGLTDINRIQSNEFQRNRIHIKLGRGGSNTYVMNNDFIQYSGPTAGRSRAYLWVVPSSETTNHGQGLVAADNKYGPENIGQDDFRVLYADEGPGTHFGDRLPNLAADSAGKISGHTFRGGLLNGSDAGSNVPFIYSTTRDIAGLLVDGLQVSSTPPQFLVKVRTPGSLFHRTVNNTVVNVVRQGSLGGLKVTNQPGLLRVWDTGQVFTTDRDIVQAYPGGSSPVGYVNLLTSRVTIGGGFNAGTGATRTNIADALGGTDAINLAITGAQISGSLNSTNLDPNRPAWVEVDIAAGDTDPLSSLRVRIADSTATNTGTGNHLDVDVKPNTGWSTYRFLVQFPNPTSTLFFNFSRGTNATGTNVKIGRAKVYHAREPQAAPPVLTSPNGTRFILRVTDDGALTTTSI